VRVRVRVRARARVIGGERRAQGERTHLLGPRICEADGHKPALIAPAAARKQLVPR
jgi:hypothetical protein